jgi:hypothetical protein
VIRRQLPTPLCERSPPQTVDVAAVLVAIALLAACSGEPPPGAAEADTTTQKESIKHPGPCATTYVTSKGKVHLGYVTRTYDKDKRLIEEKTADFAEGIDALRWTHKWTRGQNGQVLTEEFETSDGDVPNFKWDYAYDDKGRKTTQTGYESGWDRASCSFEYLAKDGKISGRICLWEYDNTDDDGNITSTDKGKHIIAYSHGPTQLAEEWLEDGASAPDKVVTKKLDGKGRVITIETDYSLRGYSEHTITHTYSESGNLVKTTFDTDANEKVDEIVLRTWDEPGNALTVAFDDDADGKPNWTWKHTYTCWK